MLQFLFKFLFEQQFWSASTQILPENELRQVVLDKKDNELMYLHERFISFWNLTFNYHFTSMHNGINVRLVPYLLSVV